MNFLESIRVALSALLANKMRSLLTMLGVIIGVGSVITMMSIVQGAQKKILDEVGSNGASQLFCFYSPKRGTERKTTFTGLRMSDVEAVERRVGSVEYVTAEDGQSVKAVRGTKSFTAQAEGVMPRHIELNKLPLERGRFIEQADLDGYAKVCVVGFKVAEDLWGKEDPMGQQLVVVVNNLRVPFSVVGVMGHKERSGFGGGNPDEEMYIPLTTMQKRLSGNDTINTFTAKTCDGVSPEVAADEVFAVLKSLHPDNAQDFVVDTLESVLKQIDTFAIIFQVVLGGVCGLSLLVGGIGIMNIMLVSVTERTREIGIRKAIGAKQRDILVRFVTESMTVSGMGGLIGVAFGYGVAQLVGLVAGDKLPPPYVPPWVVLLGFGFAVSVGMFFGIYPAYRAARLDPIQALRYE